MHRISCLSLTSAMLALSTTPGLSCSEANAGPPDPFRCHNKPPPLPEIIEDGEHYEVKEILDSRLYCGKLQYLMKWKGFGYEENSWIGENNVFAPRLVCEFHQTNLAAPRRIQKIHFDSIFHRIEDAAS